MAKLKLPQAKNGKLIIRHESKIVLGDQCAMSQDNKDNNDNKNKNKKNKATTTTTTTATTTTTTTTQPQNNGL